MKTDGLSIFEVIELLREPLFQAWKKELTISFAHSASDPVEEALRVLEWMDEVERN